MPRGIPNVRETPWDQVIEEESVPAEDFDRAALEAAEAVTSEFMRMHPPPDGERVQKKRHLTYWKMCENPRCPVEGHRERLGWITIDVATGGPFGPEQVTRYAQAIHGTNLENALGKPGGWPAPTLAIGEVGLIWSEYDANFPWGPYSQLFMAKGGLAMMPIEQFCQLGFHRDPTLGPLRKAEWSNLKWFVCDMCPEGKAEYIREGYLEQHRQAAHKEHVSALAQARETAKVMKDFVGGGNNTNDVMARFNQMAQELEELRAQLNKT